MRAWHIVFITLFLIFSLYETNKINQSYKTNAEYDKDYTQTMQWLKENSDLGSIILTDWKYGPNIATLAERGVITTTKVYPSEINFTAERYKDASKFFFTTNEENAMKIIRKYNITHVLVPKDFQFSMCRYIGICSENLTRYLTPTGELQPPIRYRLIVTRMMDGDMFYNFEKVYASKFFTIYRVMEPKPIQNDGLQQYKDLIENALENSLETKKYSDVFGIIVPHHLTYAYQIIADMFKSVKGDYDTIIILGSDHFNSSSYKISTSHSVWETLFGQLTPDYGLIEKLDLRPDEPTHIHEHSIRALLPFIKHEFPNTKIVSIIFNDTIEKEELIDLGNKISKLENVLVIASIDFSHDLDLDTALKQDAKSLDVIQNFKKDEVYSLYLDSKPALLTLLTAAELKNSKKITLLNYTNSGQLTKDYPKNVGYFSIIFQNEN